MKTQEKKKVLFASASFAAVAVFAGIRGCAQGTQPSLSPSVAQLPEANEPLTPAPESAPGEVIAPPPASPPVVAVEPAPASPPVEVAVAPSYANLRARKRIPKPTEKYRVKRGDTLWGIASRLYANGADYDVLVAANPKLQETGLRVGQVLVYPTLRALLGLAPLNRPLADDGNGEGFDRITVAIAVPAKEAAAGRAPTSLPAASIQSTAIVSHNVAALEKALEEEKAARTPVSREKNRPATATNEYYAEALAKNGRLDAAKAQIEKLVKENPNDARVRAEAARFYASAPGQGNCRKSVDEIRAAKENDQKDLSYAIEEVSLLIKCGLKTEATAAAKDLVGKIPNLGGHPGLKEILKNDKK